MPDASAGGEGSRRRRSVLRRGQLQPHQVFVNLPELAVDAPYTECFQFRTKMIPPSMEGRMGDIIFIGSPHEAPMFEEAGFLCFEPEPGHLVERVVAEHERCNLLVLTRETFAALPKWLARDLLVGVPGQVQVVGQLPLTSVEKQIMVDQLRRKAIRAARDADPIWSPRRA